MKTLILLIAIVLFSSCKTTITTNYKVCTVDGNFYVDTLEYAENSNIVLTEYLRNGKVRRVGIFNINDVIIKQK